MSKKFSESKSDGGASVSHRHDTPVCGLLVLQIFLSSGWNIKFKLSTQNYKDNKLPLSRYIATQI